MRKSIASAVAAGAVLLASGKASAAFHIMQIVEVYAGPNSYVQLQMYADGQNATDGHTIKVFDAAGTETGSATLDNVANGANQSTILIGTATVQSALGVTPDIALLPLLDQAGGKVCFDTIDCFAWGNYTGDATGVGTPFAALGTQAAKRKLAAGTPGVLDAADDTNDCANDFTAGAPAPKNNAGDTAVTDAGSSSGSSGMSSSGSSGTSGTSSGVSTVPTDGGGKTSSPSSPPSGAAPAAEDDSGCNVGGGLADFAAAPLLGLGVLGAVSRFRSRRKK